MIPQDLLTYRVFTFGGLGLATVDGTRLPPSSASRRGLAMLGLLAAAGERGMSRDKIIGFLWPESDAERARHSLNQTLYALRRDLRFEVVAATPAELRLNDDLIDSDFAAFHAAIKAGNLEQAVSIYAGPFLDGFFLNDAPEFERWVDGERSAAAAAHRRAIETLAQRATAQGRAAEAIDWWGRLAAADPLSDRAAEQLIAAMLNAGDRCGAIRYAEEFRNRVQQELDVEPAPAVLALLKRARIEPASESAQAPASAPQSAAPAPSVPRSSIRSSRNSWKFLTPAALRQRRLKATILGVVVGITLGLASTALLRFRKGTDSDSRRVFVSKFENETGDAQFDAVGMMAADWIIDGLAASQLVDVVDAVTSIEATPATTNGNFLPSAVLTSRELAARTGATLMVEGRCLIRNGRLELDATIKDARHESNVRRVPPVLVSQWEITAGIAALRQRVLTELAPLVNPALRKWASAGAMPPSYDAYWEYVVGLDGMWRDGEDAVFHLRRATEVDSSLNRARVALVDAYLNVQDEQRADSVAREADRRRGTLDAYDLHTLDYLRAMIRGDLTAAYESSMLALEALPGSPVALRRAGYAALSANHPRRAAELLSRLDPTIGACGGGCQHYWWELTSAEHMLGEYQQELVDANRSIQQYPGLLNMRFNAIRALAALGRDEEVERSVDSAIVLHADGWLNQLSVMNGAVSELRIHGRSAAAERVLSRALAWYDSLPDDAKRSRQYDFAYASALYLAHRWRESERMFQHDAQRYPGNGFHAGFVAAAAFQAGDKQTFDRIVEQLEAATAPGAPGGDNGWLGKLSGMRGDRERAVRLLRQNLTEGRDYNIIMHAEPYLDPLRGYPPFEELMRPKG